MRDTKGLQKTTSTLHNEIDEIPELSREGMRRKRGCPRKGNGIIQSLLEIF